MGHRVCPAAKSFKIVAAAAERDAPADWDVSQRVPVGRRDLGVPDRRLLGCRWEGWVCVGPFHPSFPHRQIGQWQLCSVGRGFEIGSVFGCEVLHLFSLLAPTFPWWRHNCESQPSRSGTLPAFDRQVKGASGGACGDSVSLGFTAGPAGALQRLAEPEHGGRLRRLRCVLFPDVWWGGSILAYHA